MLAASMTPCLRVFAIVRFGFFLTLLIVLARAASGQTPAPAAQMPAQKTTLEANLLPGKIHAAQAQIAAHPKDATAHIAYSAALLEASAGDDAQAEARLATTLDPTSAAAFAQLATALLCNSIGIQFGSGFHREAAIEAGRTAVQLDPKNPTYIAALAQLYDVNSRGEPYGEGAQFADAVREFGKLKALNPTVAARYDGELLASMLLNHQIDKVFTDLPSYPLSPAREAVAIATLTAFRSVAEARERANLITDPKQRSITLRTAATLTMRLGLYPQSADLLEDTLQGPSDALIKQQVQILRYLQHTRDEPPTPLDPRSPVYLLLRSTADGNLVEHASEIYSRHASASEAEWQDQNQERARSLDFVQVAARQYQLPVNVIKEVILSNATIAATGDDLHGYLVTLATIGVPRQTFLVSRDEGRYRIVGDANGAAEAGDYTLYLLAAKRPAEAHALLDWRRTLVSSTTKKDPLGSNLFLRLWPASSADADQDTMEVAALALTLARAGSQAPLTPALTAYAKSPDNLDLAQLLAAAYLARKEPAAAKPLLDKLLTKYPDSISALVLTGQFFALTHDYASWAKLLAAALARHPGDPDLLRQSALQSECANEFPQARKILAQLIATTPTPGDRNNYAWLALFDPAPTTAAEAQVDATSLDDAKLAVDQTHHAFFGTLHTLACLYAGQDHTAEARQTLFEAMAIGHLAQPNPAIWFGFASIYQQLGATDAAIAAYKRVPRPDGTPLDPTDVWVLAQARLNVLHAH